MLLLAPGFGVLLLGMWIYCIFDCISTDESLVRNLPKGGWVLIVLFVPDVGSIAWLLLGRPMYAGWRPGDTSYRPAPRVRGPEDSPSWSPAPAPSASERARLEAWEADLRRREQEVQQAGGATPDGPPKDDDEGKGTDPGFPLRW